MKIRNAPDPAYLARHLALVMQNPRLLSRPEYAGFREYVQDLDASPSGGMFDNLSPDEFTRMLSDYKEYGNDEETVAEFFSRWR